MAHCTSVAFMAPQVGEAQGTVDSAASLSDLGLRVFRDIASTTSEPNVVLSPLSVGLAVALLTEGAEGETREQLLRALSVPSHDWPVVAPTIGRLLMHIATDTAVTLSIATALWVDEGRELGPDFRSRAEHDHRAHVAVADLQAESTRERVDDWARRQTDGRISRAMPPSRPDMALLLLNAVYFKGLWQSPFDSAATEPRPFERMRGDSIPAATMRRSGPYARFETPYATGLRMPYRGDRFACYVVLPADTVTVSQVVERVTSAEIRAWAEMATEVPVPVTVSVPRFEHRGSWDLLEPFEHAGMRRILSADSSQMNGLWANAAPWEVTHVTDAVQSTFIQFDEEGTEAAAVTSVGIGVTGVVRRVEFTVDRPFLVVIRDDESGAVLFVARIGDPTDDGG